MTHERTQSTKTRIPRDAREGLMRAWLAILSERHPGVVWVPIEAEQSSVHRPEPSEPRPESTN